MLRLLDTVDDDTKEHQLRADIDIEGPSVWREVVVIEEQRNVSRVVKTTFAIPMRQRRSVDRADCIPLIRIPRLKGTPTARHRNVYLAFSLGLTGDANAPYNIAGPPQRLSLVHL